MFAPGEIFKERNLQLEEYKFPTVSPQSEMSYISFGNAGIGREFKRIYF